MFFEKLTLGAICGAMLGVLFAIFAFFDGKTLSEIGQGFIGCIMAGVVFIFWWSGKQQEQGDDGSNDISHLHRELQTAHEAAARYEADGDRGAASYWRSQIAIIESNLRSRGA